MTTVVREQIKTSITEKWHGLRPVLNERSRRIWAATEARTIGYGGVCIVSEATHIARDTIYHGLRELSDALPHTSPGRIRQPGGGRKRLTEKDPTLVDDLARLISPIERGDPENPLRWTAKSTEYLASALQKQHTISPDTVARILKQEHYSLQSNHKRHEGTDNPDRDAQFHYINESVKKQQENNQPCISIDTKKKENIGNYKNNGTEWCKKGEPIEVNMHDFPDPQLGKAIPHGIYDLIEGTGWVTVGIDHDTAAFAVASIQKWWESMGRQRYPQATELLITADCGGSNNARSNLWKRELQKLANDFTLTIHVRHFPPGTSKWNKIEHRLFSMITKNWRGKPLVSLAAIVNLIGSTKTKTGLTVKAVLDKGTYPTGLTVSPAELEALTMRRDDFHGEWNYSIVPQRQ